MMQLSIIILSFNTQKLTLACIDSLQKNYKKQFAEKIFEIVLVDNNSSDETITELKKKNYPFVTLVENKQNYGFSKGINIGVSRAKGVYVLFLNSDTTVENEGIIRMLSFLEESPEVGILGGKLTNEDGSTQPSAGVFYTIPNVMLLLMGAERFGKLRFSPQRQMEVEWVSGAMMMIKKSFFESIGMFDEKIFMYMEDMELCFRVKKQGKKVFFYPLAQAVHISHASSNRSFAIVQIYKGIVYYYRKHTSLLAYIFVKLLLLAKAVILVLVGLLTGRRYLRDTYYQALKGIL